MGKYLISKSQKLAENRSYCRKVGQKPHDVRRQLEFQIHYDLKTIFMHVDEM